MKGLKKKTLAVLLTAEIAIISFFTGRLTAAEQEAEYPPGTDPADIYITAQNYLTAGNYSEEGLIMALKEYEHFDESQTRKVVGKMDIEWQAEADEEVRAYLDMTGNSEKQVREYLRRDLFTDEQIDEAIDKADPDWHEQALRCADFLRQSGANDAEIRMLLLDRGFRESEL